MAPHQGLRCEDRTSLWRLRLPAAEATMRRHYSEESVPALTEATLLHVLDQLRGRRPLDFALRRKGTLRLVSRHMLRAVHWWSLERTGPEPLRTWAADSLARHVLLGLDELLRALKCQNLRCYFHPRCNLMLQCARGGTMQNEDAYASDARLLEAYLLGLHASSTEWLDRSSRPCTSEELLEKELVARWPQVLASLPRGTMSGHCGYGPRQIQYLGLVLKEVLQAKACLGQSFNCSSFFNLGMDPQTSESTENLIYLLGLVLKQAKDQVQTATLVRRKRRSRRRSRAERKRSCATAYFDRSVEMLIDIVRKDRDTAYLDLENEAVMAKALLKWLYFGMEEDRRVLGPLLRPYLGNLFNASHENAWHVESWRRRQEAYTAEMRSLSLFCKLVTAREILPANGIVESLSKGWAWAEGVARTIERSDNGLRLVFLAPERILRYQLKFAEDKGPGSYSTWSKARSIGKAVRRASTARTILITATDTLPGLNSRDLEIAAPGKGVAGHVELREASPLTLVAGMTGRRGRQRGPGGLIPALVTLNKFRVLQEVAQLLPPKERAGILELVQQASRAAGRCTRRNSCPDSSASGDHRQVYTPRSEPRLCTEPPTAKYSPRTKQQRIVLERQLQLRREISEIQDTLTRGLRSRSQLPVWDSTSMASWGSSVGSLGRTRLKRHQGYLWDTVRGPSSLWDSVSCNSTFSKVISKETMKNDTSLMGQSNNKTAINTEKEENTEDHKLPSWELLEKALNKKFLERECIKPNTFEENKDVNVEYLVISNDTKELPKKIN